MKDIKLEQILNNKIVQVILNHNFDKDLLSTLGVSNDIISKFIEYKEDDTINVNFIYNDVEHNLSLRKILVDTNPIYRYDLKTKESELTVYIDPDIGSYSLYVINDIDKEYNFTFKIKNTIITNEEITLEVFESETTPSTNLVLPELLKE